jgi:hypothetical protein
MTLTVTQRGRMWTLHEEKGPASVRYLCTHIFNGGESVRLHPGLVWEVCTLLPIQCMDTWERICEECLTAGSFHCVSVIRIWYQRLRVRAMWCDRSLLPGQLYRPVNFASGLVNKGRQRFPEGDIRNKLRIDVINSQERNKPYILYVPCL